jgi:F-type H+-transporting ATPase subunit b
MEGLYPSDILIHIINIVVLFLLLRAILLKPVIRFLNERAERINTQIKDAETLKDEAQALKQAYEQHMEAYEEEGHNIIRDSQVKATENAEAIIKEAKNQAEAIVSGAHVRIANDKAQAVAEARAEVALLATEIASRILQREVSVDDNKAVVESFFQNDEKR